MGYGNIAFDYSPTYRDGYPDENRQSKRTVYDHSAFTNSRETSSDRYSPSPPSEEERVEAPLPPLPSRKVPLRKAAKKTVRQSLILSSEDSTVSYPESPINIRGRSSRASFEYVVDPSTDRAVRAVSRPRRNFLYDIDRDYTDEQNWLLNNRQGDQYFRLPEWNDYPMQAQYESDSMIGRSISNEGMVWEDLTLRKSPPKTTFERLSNYR